MFNEMLAMGSGSGGQVASGYIANLSSDAKITCGFKPSVIQYYIYVTNGVQQLMSYDKTVDPDKYTRYNILNNTASTPNVGQTGETGGIKSIDNDGITVEVGSLTYSQFQRIRWVAAE